MTIHPDSYWTHRHDGYEVKIEADEDLVDKAPGDASWHAAIAYRRTDKDDSPKYVRTIADFLAKFEQVPEEKAVA
jgi:hypothetical protein